MRVPILVSPVSPDRVVLALILRHLGLDDLRKLFYEFQTPVSLRRAKTIPTGAMREVVAACEIRAEIMRAWDGGDRETRKRILNCAQRYVKGTAR
jgi:hypothetical protein